MVGENSVVKKMTNEIGKTAEKMAKELSFKKLDKKKAKDINNKIESQDDSAASGMGVLFD